MTRFPKDSSQDVEVGGRKFIRAARGLFPRKLGLHFIKSIISCQLFKGPGIPTTAELAMFEVFGNLVGKAIIDSRVV